MSTAEPKVTLETENEQCNRIFIVMGYGSPIPTTDNPNPDAEIMGYLALISAEISRQEDHYPLILFTGGAEITVNGVTTTEAETMGTFAEKKRFRS